MKRKKSLKPHIFEQIGEHRVRIKNLKEYIEELEHEIKHLGRNLPISPMKVIDYKDLELLKDYGLTLDEIVTVYQLKG